MPVGAAPCGRPDGAAGKSETSGQPKTYGDVVPKIPLHVEFHGKAVAPKNFPKALDKTTERVTNPEQAVV